MFFPLESSDLCHFPVLEGEMGADVGSKGLTQQAHSKGKTSPLLAPERQLVSPWTFLPERVSVCLSLGARLYQSDLWGSWSLSS